MRGKYLKKIPFCTEPFKIVNIEDSASFKCTYLQTAVRITALKQQVFEIKRQTTIEKKRINPWNY